ncbi:GNAT family N-acetyltransferase [Myxococcaceae bacterium JPH2]|nr:GNAT family N-acetyltransferase [Myxococcaceae bacterium JPH2]
MQAHVLRSTAELDPKVWDRLVHPSLYLSSDWLRARSRTLKAAERFILVTGEDGSPLLSTPSYLVDGKSHPGFDPARVLEIGDLADADLASQPDDLQALTRLRAELRQRGAEWTPSLVMGAPGRYGGVSYAPGINGDLARPALRAAVDAIERQAKEDHAKSIAWLYFLEDEDPWLAAMLRERGYLNVVVESECYLPITWSTFDGYLASFKAEGRKKIRNEMAALSDAGATIELHGEEALGPELAALERKWRVKYGRSPTIPEILADYEELRSFLGRSLRVFVAKKDGRALGFTVFLEQGDTWYARFGGFDYDAGNLFLYFNLLFYKPIQAMIERGVKCGRYSLKSYQAKRSRGCQLSNVLAFVRPPPGWEGLPGAVELINRVQRARFAAVSNRRITPLPI